MPVCVCVRRYWYWYLKHTNTWIIKQLKIFRRFCMNFSIRVRFAFIQFTHSHCSVHFTIDYFACTNEKSEIRCILHHIQSGEKWREKEKKKRHLTETRTLNVLISRMGRFVLRLSSLRLSHIYLWHPLCRTHYHNVHTHAKCTHMLLCVWLYAQSA